MSTTLIFVLPFVLALFAGGLAGGLAAWSIVTRREKSIVAKPIEPAADPFVDAEIDIASARWGAERKQDAVAVGVMSDHLKQLYRLGLRKGWFE